MSKEQIIQKAGWFVGILVILAVVAVFAAVRTESPSSEPVSVRRPANPTSLEKIINARKKWDVAFQSWSGKSAPDLTVKGIDGNVHKLSDYHGKNLLIVFWATWCPPCKLEIPHLIELRKAFSEDELAILAISNEPPEHLRHFAKARGMNYAVASLAGTALPAPFADVTSIPTTFFIDRHGTIKLAAVGSVSFEEAKAILRAGK